ncbi:MAG: hypothetical protein OES13_10985 [Acidimicrobiia bacterium]|nr:hypothetical protein [Acidimicrobiia bacterium]
MKGSLQLRVGQYETPAETRMHLEIETDDVEAEVERPEATAD